MKVKVVKAYIDRYDGTYHEAGELANMTGGRFEEIEKAGHYVELIGEDLPEQSDDEENQECENPEKVEHEESEGQDRQKNKSRGRKR